MINLVKFIKEMINKRDLLKMEKELIKLISYYNIIDEMIINQTDGKTPKLPIYARKDLINWLKINKPKNDKFIKRLIEVKKELI